MAERVVINGLKERGTLQHPSKGAHTLTCLKANVFEAKDDYNASMKLRLKGENGAAFQVTVWLPGETGTEEQNESAMMVVNTVCKLFEVETDDTGFNPDDFEGKKSVKKVSVYVGKNKKTNEPETRVEWPVGL